MSHDFLLNGSTRNEEHTKPRNGDYTTNSTDAASAATAVLKPSVPMPSMSTKIRGVDFNDYLSTPITVTQLTSHLSRTGFQASNLARAIEIINNMRKWKPGSLPLDPDDVEKAPPPPDAKCTIFLGYTSNLISSGLRETLRFLVQHRHVDCVVTTAGGIEEDLIKCLAPTYLGEFTTPGAILRDGGLNRIGNLVVPNDNYCAFEDWLTPILDKMLLEQELYGKRWTPSKMIQRLGKEINHEDSVLYWAWKNDIPVFSPALTDGSLGDMLYFHTLKNTLSSDIPRHISLDIIPDIVSINTIAMRAHCTGVIILGGGLIKHHICNANLMRNGADFAVYINTSGEFDGSDAGASPEEAISWGKIRAGAQSVKVFCDATIAFPMIVASTFAADTIIEAEGQTE